jgi:hypothetical protein
MQAIITLKENLRHIKSIGIWKGTIWYVNVEVICYDVQTTKEKVLPSLCLHCVFCIILRRGISYSICSICGSNHSHKPSMFRSLVTDICVHSHHRMTVNLVEVQHSESHTLCSAKLFSPNLSIQSIEMYPYSEGIRFFTNTLPYRCILYSPWNATFILPVA